MPATHRAITSLRLHSGLQLPCSTSTPPLCEPDLWDPWTQRLEPVNVTSDPLAALGLWRWRCEVEHSCSHVGHVCANVCVCVCVCVCVLHARFRFTRQLRSWQTRFCSNLHLGYRQKDRLKPGLFLFKGEQQLYEGKSLPGELMPE